MKATDDVMLRLKSFPAGTARLGIVYALASRLLKHPTAALLSDPGSFSSIPQERQKVLENPAKYHIGADYLTGRREAYEDTVFSEYLGRAGTWGSYFARGITLINPIACLCYLRFVCVCRAANDKSKRFDIFIF